MFEGNLDKEVPIGILEGMERMAQIVTLGKKRGFKRNEFFLGHLS